MAEDPLETTTPEALMDEDPVVEACIRDALSPYEGALSQEELADYRRFLALFITTHPAAAPLYERLRARPATVAESGVVARPGAAAGDTMAVRGDRTSGGRP